MYWPEFLGIALAHLFAVASPGPDFAVVLRQTVRHGTTTGIWTSLGVGAGIGLHISYCLLGVALLVSQTPRLFEALKWMAAAYLIWLGLRSLLAARTGPGGPSGLDQEARESGRAVGSRARAIGLGFLTNGLNPKATLFFLALFTVVIDTATPLRVQLLYGVYLALATFAWFAGLSLALGRPMVRGALLRAGPWFEAAMGLVLLALALQILWWG